MKKKKYAHNRNAGKRTMREIYTEFFRACDISGKEIDHAIDHAMLEPETKKFMNQKFSATKAQETIDSLIRHKALILSEFFAYKRKQQQITFLELHKN